MRKQITSLLLSLLMLLTLLPTAAWAENAVHSGKCGKDLTWTLENGVLTIEGLDNMENYSSAASTPWADYALEIGIVKLPDELTSIGDYAFAGCKNLTEIELPKKLKSIGYYAFDGCQNLKEITIPHQLEALSIFTFRGCTNLAKVNFSANSTIDTIGAYAFYGCRSLKSIDFPQSLKTIGQAAFEYTGLVNVKFNYDLETIYDSAFDACHDLVSVEIDRNVSSIGDWVFDECENLREINVANGNASYSSVDGVLFNKGKTILIKYPAGHERTHYSIPSGVTEITRCAFSETQHLASVSIPSSVKNINQNVFDVTAKYGFTDVFYDGSTESWANISIASNGNDGLSTAVIHYGGKCGPGYETETKNTPAACTTPGIKDRIVCATCGAVIVAGTDIPATGHTEITDEAVTPTCTTPGKTEGKHCEVCGKVLTAQEELPATGVHTWNDGEVTVRATCDAEGTMTYTCTVCGGTKTEPIPAIGSLLGDVNGDGTVNITDMALVYQYLTGQTEFTDGHKKAADVNRDGIVDVYDLQRLYEAVTGIDPLS